MSWKFRITILYLGFVALIVTMVVMASRQRVDLVTDDYYQRELKFQQQLDRMNESKTLAAQPEIRVTADSLEIHFPQQVAGETLSGTASFYRPSCKTDDFSTGITATAGVQHVARSRFKKGLYQVQLSWEAGGKNYYNDISVYVP